MTSAQAQARYAWASFCRINGGTRTATRFLSDQSVATYTAATAPEQSVLFPIYLNSLTNLSWNAPDNGGTDCSLLPPATMNTALCVAGCTPTPVCGNAVCESGESASSCPTDCGSVCGDGLCAFDESSLSCPTDCGSVCGDGLCELDESSFSCPEDCGFSCLQGSMICPVF